MSLSWLNPLLQAAGQQSLLRVPTVLHHHSSTRARYGTRDVTVFCTNDYLGLRYDPRLARAASAAATTHGTGAGASRLVSGDTELHEATEADIARFVHQPSALLTTSGYAANVGAIAALAGSDDVLFSDALNHASIIDGCRLSRARIVVYPHADANSLAKLVPRQRPFRRGWVLTESHFSMDGDVAPLDELAILCAREDLHLYVDEAHGIGVYGPDGRGLAVQTGVQPDVLVGTLGKSLGTGGAFISGSADLHLYLWNHCRSFVFSTGLPPPLVAAAREAVGLLQTDPTLLTRLRANVAHLRESLLVNGYIINGHPESCILPLLIGSERETLVLSQKLLDDGIFVQAIRPPTVPPGTARLRITVTAAHTPNEIEALVASLYRHAHQHL